MAPERLEDLVRGGRGDWRPFRAVEGKGSVSSKPDKRWKMAAVTL